MMQKKYLLFCLSILLTGCTYDRDFPETNDVISNPDYELVHYWNFNDSSDEAALITPTYTNGGAALTYNGSYFDSVDEGTAINSRNDDDAGAALRLRNPSGEFIISIPTSGYKDIILNYAATRTGSGSQAQSISYTIDGVNYIQDGLIQSDFSITENGFNLISINFGDIEGADNNANFKVKIEFDEASSLISNGNNRIDNLTVDGIRTESTPEPTEPSEDPDLYLMHYWSFNDNSNLNTLIAPTTGNGSLEYMGNYYDSVSPGSDTNARNDDTAGTALRLRNESGDFIITAPTGNYKNIILKYVTTRTGSGSQTQSVSYTTDGVNYTQSGISQSEFTIEEDIYSLIEVDFSGMPAVNDNENFKIKISFDAPSAVINNGNNRIDNITIEGNTL